MRSLIGNTSTAVDGSEHSLSECSSWFAKKRTRVTLDWTCPGFQGDFYIIWTSTSTSPSSCCCIRSCSCCSWAKSVFNLRLPAHVSVIKLFLWEFVSEFATKWENGRVSAGEWQTKGKLFFISTCQIWLSFRNISLFVYIPSSQRALWLWLLAANCGYEFNLDLLTECMWCIGWGEGGGTSTCGSFIDLKWQIFSAQSLGKFGKKRRRPKTFVVARKRPRFILCVAIRDRYDARNG